MPSSEAVPVVTLRSLPAWALVLAGAIAGGGGGSLLGPALAGGTSTVTTEQVRAIVDEAVVRNNAVLVGQFQLLLAQDKLSRSSP